MANLTVEREIEVRVNMDQLVCGDALNEVGGFYSPTHDFNRWVKADKVTIENLNLAIDDLFTGEDEREDYIEGSLEKQDCKIKAKVLVYVKAKKYEELVDELVEKYRAYVEEVLPSLANIGYAKGKLLGYIK